MMLPSGASAKLNSETGRGEIGRREREEKMLESECEEEKGREGSGQKNEEKRV